VLLTTQSGEEYFVIDGVFSDAGGDYHKGSYVRHPINSSHEPWSTTGTFRYFTLYHSFLSFTLSSSLFFSFEIIVMSSSPSTSSLGESKIIFISGCTIFVKLRQMTDETEQNLVQNMNDSSKYHKVKCQKYIVDSVKLMHLMNEMSSKIDC
jgi:hypothetical protein